ncbi:heparinase II/III domain-containing protein [Brachybacterium sp. UNK5269]|uniref:heparinase II/III domain-containing protein n=1 Tax=Brachybacterium sp. UNK5269 TaxID=3408576 RepID=UPI003BAFE04A
MLIENTFSEGDPQLPIAEGGLERYAKEQQDPIIGVKTGRIVFTENDEFWDLKSSLPIAMHLPKNTSADKFDWSLVSDVESQGSALWKFSLGYLPALISEFGAVEDVTMLLESAWEWNCSSGWEERANWMTSLDHAIATRLRAMTMLRVLYKLAGVSEPPEVTLFAVNDALHVARNPSLMFPINNHGAMAAIAAIHAGTLFPEVSEAVSKEGAANDFATLGWSELQRIVNEIFDEYGIANENSPEYQRYWISLLTPLIKFDELIPTRQGEAAHGHGLQSLLLRITDALDAFVGEDSRLIPIGDSHARLLKSPKRERTLVSESSGFAIYRSAGTMLTLNCGSSNYAHKHCDDTSITLQRNGVGLILDSGFFGHDWNDKRVIFTKSQTAHSGLFYDGLDDLHPGKLYWPGNQRVVGRLERMSTRGFHVKCSVEIDGELALERTLQVLSPKIIEIKDFAYRVSSDLGRPVKRFVLPLGASIDISGHRVAVSHEGVTMEIFSDVESDSTAVRLTSGATHPELKGWVSPELNQLEPAYCLELPCEIDSVSTLRIVTD